MWIVDVQPDGAEEILDTHVVCVHAVDEILIPPAYNNLEGKHSTAESWTAPLKATVCNFSVRNITEQGVSSESALLEQHFWSRIAEPPEVTYCRFKQSSSVQDRLTCLVMVISSWVSNPSGLCFLFELSKVMDTVALVMPASPFLYTKSWRFDALTWNNPETQHQVKDFEQWKVLIYLMTLRNTLYLSLDSRFMF